jgi:RND family efflux transporter MFP subunit
MTTPLPEAPEPDAHAPAPTRRKPRIVRYLAIALLVLVVVATTGIVERNNSDAKLTTWTTARAVVNVDLVSPKRATQDEHLTLPATVDAFYTAPIHSRVNGYVKMWYFDIGARVKAGQVLAKIDTPDLDQQYAQAKGELLRAQANYNLAVVTAERWKALRASNAVSQQTVDEKVGDAAAQKAQVVAMQANLDRLKAMEDFKDIVAPFDGVVTARRIDVGALVSATNSSASALYDISDISKMRVYVRVPQVYAASMHKGLKVKLSLPQYPHETFEGALDTTSNAISDVARALLVEAIFPNSKGLLSPGAYAEARFALPLDPDKLVVPSSAMIFRGENPEVAAVKDGKVVLQKVTILVDTGPEIEVSTGIEPDDKIVLNPSYAMETGEEVNVVKVDGKAPSSHTAPRPGQQRAQANP